MECNTLAAISEEKDGKYYVQAETRHGSNPRYASHNDIQALEELGYRNLLASVQTAWSYVGLVLEASSLPDALPRLSDPDMYLGYRSYKPTKDDQHSQTKPPVVKPEEGGHQVWTSDYILAHIFKLKIPNALGVIDTLQSKFPLRRHPRSSTVYGHQLSTEFLSCQYRLQ